MFLYLADSTFQMTRVTKDKCLDIITKFEPAKEAQQLGHLGIDGKSL